MSEFNGATLMITGGTGSFGHAVLKHFLTSDIGQIRIFSRDEKKQDDMRHELQAKYPDQYKKVKFYIGDVRNPQSLADAMPGVDYIFHAAALKQVPSCEFFPMEAVRTNVIGTDNMLHAAINASAAGESERIISEADCGLCSPIGDVEKLAENIKVLINDPDRAVKGRNARRYFEEHFEKKLLMDQIDEYLR